MNIVTKNIILSENTSIAPDGFYGYVIQNLSEALVTIDNCIVLRQYEKLDMHQLPCDSVYRNYIQINCNSIANMKVAVILIYIK